MGLSFVDIALPTHANLCLAFRIDSYVCSFGSADTFHGPYGKGGERYLAHLVERIRAFPGCCVHARDEHGIVGQIELRPFPGEPKRGYVNLFYLVPEARGRGYGKQLQRYAEQFFAARQVERMYLDVSPTNAIARRFYDTQGGILEGPRQDRPELLRMSKAVPKVSR
ncbi:MAG: GNAT family N-acetyltransferase [Myxococcales bacterium]|nr:GNAT family N-acetyltransferase [Myxococcales bacterium]